MNRETARGLYVHLPFCLKKCAYCDFVSYAHAFDQEDAYIDALLTEFCTYRGEKIDTVYFGGGTPTALKIENLLKLIDGVYSAFCVLPDAEVTVECNPKTADAAAFRALLHHGVNRLSIGVQSFDDACLQTIGRVHTADDAKKSVEDAARAGFCNVSLDLMFGLPGQSAQSLQSSVQTAMSLPIRHISCYGLILEEHTPLWHQVQTGGLTLPGEDEEVQMYRDLIKQLAAHDFVQYEISNFAKDGFWSRHNLKYWNDLEYIGCGAAAHSYFQGERFFHGADLADYIQDPNRREGVTALSVEEQMGEFMMLGLRKTAGVSRSEFFARFGILLDDRYKKEIETFTQAGLLESVGDRLRLSQQGVYVSNTVMCEFV